MARSKYREERTLVRGLRRLPPQERGTFKSNILRLKRHFEQFNKDVADICQWLMGIRPSGKKATEGSRPFWDYILDPSSVDPNCDIKDADRRRLGAFDYFNGITDPAKPPKTMPPSVRDSIDYVRTLPVTASGQNMLQRLAGMRPEHRMILLKSAANWVTQRYVRGFENWLRQNEIWKKEKMAWEAEHPALTEEVRTKYNECFVQAGVRSNRPRVCALEKLAHGRNDCDYAGERIPIRNTTWKNHSPLCVRFWRFLNMLPDIPRIARRYFIPNAQKYLEISRSCASLNRDTRLDRFFQAMPQAGKWFSKAWDTYLRHLGLNEQTLLNKYKGELPHCVEFKPDQDCTWNQHTEQCANYYESAKQLTANIIALEPEYREWRRRFLRPPRKPVFEYPAPSKLPVAKIFGDRFYKIDLQQSVVELRLDDMPEDQSLKFAFKPWPPEYDLQPSASDITSVSINFSGNKARLGLRFRVAHRQSRIRITQDEIDFLRSRTFPRASQDGQFLSAVRKRVLESLDKPDSPTLRILSVDLGTDGAGYGVFEGKKFTVGGTLPVVKIDKLYKSRPAPAGEGRASKSSSINAEKFRGLSRHHVTRHLESLSQGASKIAEFRAIDGIGELQDHDYRRLTAHIRLMIRDWTRVNASQIIKVAEQHKVDLILFESMRGFRAPSRDKADLDKKRRLAFFAYGRIRRKVTEKAVERGMRVITVPYKYSSQQCSECGHVQKKLARWKNNKRRGRFECEREQCRFKELSSDENAARVLGRVFWGDLELPTA
ncbi:MAG: hypothetical protein Kow0074_23280 [Candidatus Zixiibacteriota bacterium]